MRIRWHLGMGRRAVRLSVAALAVGLGTTAIGQPPSKAMPATAAEDGAKDPRGRLPNFFRHVVTEEQRDRIYAVLAKYEAQIADLERQIQVLEARRDAEVEGMLTDEQRAKLARVKEFFEQERSLDKKADASKAAARDRAAEAVADGADPAEAARTVEAGSK